MLASEIITDVRRYLNDERTGEETWKDAVLLRYLSEAQRRIAELRPDLFLAANDTMSAPSDVTNTGDTLTLDEKSREALVLCVCSKALSEDNPDKFSIQLSDRHIGQMLNILKGSPK